jgi:hypothetical protein
MHEFDPQNCEKEEGRREGGRETGMQQPDERWLGPNPPQGAVALGGLGSSLPNVLPCAILATQLSSGRWLFSHTPQPTEVREKQKNITEETFRVPSESSSCRKLPEPCFRTHPCSPCI